MAATPVIALLLALAPQEPSSLLSGNVRDLAGAPVSGARITFAPLPLPRRLPRGQKGRYGEAIARHWREARLPVGFTDRDGEWRVALSVDQAALAFVGEEELEMRVEARGFAPYRTPIGNRLIDATRADVQLERLPQEPPLRLELRAAAPVRRDAEGSGNGSDVRGFVLVERPFRVHGGRGVWLQELLAIGNGGTVGFAEGPRICGELPAPSTTARPEAYRVSVFAAGMQPLQVLLPPGSHALQLEGADRMSRRVLAGRGEAAPGPIVATWRLAGREVELSLADASVPLLGGEAPVRVRCPLGPVPVDAWDPDAPLHVDRDAAAGAPAEREQAGDDGGDRSVAALSLVVLGRDGNPLHGAAIWLEDQLCGLSGVTVHAVTDARGEATLARVPIGAWRALLAHPAHGSSETLLTVARDAAPLELRLLGTPAPAEADGGLAGTLLLDVGPAPAADAECEIGVLTSAGRVVRRPFREWSRLVRLDGLVPGPTTLFVRTGEDTTLLGGVLAGSVHDPAVELGTVPPRRVAFEVRDASGAPAKGVRLALVEDAPRGRMPSSMNLFTVLPPEAPGRFAADVRWRGALWVRVLDESGGHADVLLAPEAEAGPIAVSLQAPPPLNPGEKDDGGDR